MNLVMRWASVLVEPSLAAETFLDRGKGGMGDAMWLLLAALLALYTDWFLRVVLVGWDLGWRAAFIEVAILMRMELWPALGAVVGLTIVGLLASTLFGAGGIGIGRWLDLAAMGYIPVLTARLAGALVREAAGLPRLPPGRLGLEWYLGGLWALAVVVWMARSRASA